MVVSAFAVRESEDRLTVQGNSILPARTLAVKAAPFIVVAAAAIAVRSPIAADYPFAALLLFLWIVSDTMMLALLARSTAPPSWQAVISVLAGASFTVWLGSPGALHAALWSKPIIAAGMAMIIAAHVALAFARARHVLGSADVPAVDRWTAAISQLLPPALVRLAAAELKIIHMALFRWGGPADVPANSRAFSYHKHLAPMCTTLLVLSGIEIAVYHLLMAHWSRTGAIIMFVISDVGFVYLIGLIKSFRFRPVLLTPEGVRVRAGFLVDQRIPLAAIISVETDFAGESVRDAATLNASLLAWPNILLRLDQPIRRRTFLKSRGPFSSVAFRLDDPEPFVRLLLWRLGEKAG